MTMLDRMRRHKGWLKWSLAIVILAFIVLYIPSFLKQDAAGNNDVVASVEGREITVGRFRQAYHGRYQPTVRSSAATSTNACSNSSGSISASSSR